MSDAARAVLHEAITRRRGDSVTLVDLLDAILAIGKSAETGSSAEFLSRAIGARADVSRLATNVPEPIETLERFQHDAIEVIARASSVGAGTLHVRHLVGVLLEGGRPEVEARFEALGASSAELRERFEVFIRDLESQPGGVNATPSRASSGPPFNARVTKLLAVAQQLDGGSRGPLEHASALLAAFVEEALETTPSRTSAHWLLGRLRSDIRTQWPILRGALFPAWTKVSAPNEVMLLGPAANIVQGAVDLAQEAGAKATRSAHLLCSILSSKSADVDGLLSNLGWNVESAKAALLEQATVTWQIHDDPDAWRRRLGPDRSWATVVWRKLGERARVAFAGAAESALDSSLASLDARTLAAALVPHMDESLLAALAAAIPKRAGDEATPSALLLQRIGIAPRSPQRIPDVMPRSSTEVERSLAASTSILLGLDGENFSADVLFFLLWVPSDGDEAAIDPLLVELGIDADKLLEDIIVPAAKLDARYPSLLRTLLKRRRSESALDRAYLDGDGVSGAIKPDRDLLDARRPALRFAKLLAAKDIAPPIALGLFGNWGSGKTFFMGLMRDAIDTLTADSSAAYVRRVAHIDFNAWHYQDTNLWATLALRIFEGIAHEIGGKDQATVETTRAALHSQVESSKKRKADASVRLKRAIRKRARLGRELEERLQTRQREFDRSLALRAKAAWKALHTTMPELESEAKKLGDDFGITPALKSAGDLARLRADVERVRQRSGGVLAALGARFRGEASIATVLTILLFVGAAIGLGALVEWAARSWNVLPASASTLVQVAALASSLAAWCGARVAQLNRALTRISEVEAAFARAEADVVSDEKARAIEAKLVDQDELIATTKANIDSAERTIREASAELERIARGGLVYDFLAERQQSASYLSHLGLISTVRTDMQTLRSLLRDFEKNGIQPIERIILYVDDLDRCSPDRVLQVLQAVHLLLAFDLFNVVVGVDARWLEGALKTQAVGTADSELRPRDYLEKIFQIPYSLAPIEESSFKTLIGGLIESRSEWRAKQRNAKVVAAPSPGSQVQSTPTTPTQPTRVDVAAKPLPDASAKPEIVRPAEATRVDKAPPTVFEGFEERFIQSLDRFIDRPRLAKRFVNIYRLLRVHAAETPEVDFAGEPESVGYKAALILLAINIGHPDIYPKILRALRATGDEDGWQDWLQKAKGRLGADGSPAFDEKDLKELGVIAKKLAPLSIPSSMAPYKLWAPRVGRYAFDWSRPT